MSELWDVFRLNYILVEHLLQEDNPEVDQNYWMCMISI